MRDPSPILALFAVLISFVNVVGAIPLVFTSVVVQLLPRFPKTKTLDQFTLHEKNKLARQTGSFMFGQLITISSFGVTALVIYLTTKDSQALWLWFVFSVVLLGATIGHDEFASRRLDKMRIYPPDDDKN